jgi:hypothetical protein
MGAFGVSCTGLLISYNKQAASPHWNFPERWLKYVQMAQIFPSHSIRRANGLQRTGLNQQGKIFKEFLIMSEESRKTPKSLEYTVWIRERTRNGSFLTSAYPNPCMPLFSQKVPLGASCPPGKATCSIKGPSQVVASLVHLLPGFQKTSSCRAPGTEYITLTAHPPDSCDFNLRKQGKEG